jgi:hypothetical protein
MLHIVCLSCQTLVHRLDAVNWVAVLRCVQLWRQWTRCGEGITGGHTMGCSDVQKWSNFTHAKNGARGCKGMQWTRATSNITEWKAWYVGMTQRGI